VELYGLFRITVQLEEWATASNRMVAHEGAWDLQKQVVWNLPLVEWQVLVIRSV